MINEPAPDAAAVLRATLASATTPAQLALLLLPAPERRLLEFCALPLRFTSQLVDDVLRQASDVSANDVTFERLTTLPGVAPKPGCPGWFLVEPVVREQAEHALLDSSHYRQLNRRLADWFQEQRGDFESEVFFNRLACDYDAAKTALTARFSEAINRFDLATCGALLDVLDLRSGLDADLATFRTDARGLLRARAAFADDYYRTTRYLDRPALTAAFDELLATRNKFILHVHGAGGRGKTMFLRWVASRRCLPRDIPIARVDFDFLDDAEHGLEPRFFFGKLAEQLSPQIRTAPLNEMLEAVREMRFEAVARRASGDYGKSVDAKDEEDEIVSRFATIIAEHCHGPVVLVFDTLEEARFRHDVDVKAIADAVATMRLRIAERATGKHDPHLCLVLAGRYSLEQQYPEVHERYRNETIPLELSAFTDDESRAYLVTSRGLAASAPLDAVIKSAKGNPFTLSLYADLLQNNEALGVEDIAGFADLDTLYLVERILKRISDPALRWMIRYGVLARRLTLAFMADVLAPHLERAMRGDVRDDDPARDNVRSPDRWRSVWAGTSAVGGSIDIELLWNALGNYASMNAWIRVDPDHDETLILAPVVTHPMRRALRPQPIVAEIHKGAIRVFKRLVAARGPGIYEALASLTYHEFQLIGVQAAEAWRARLHEYADDADGLRTLAQVVLSDDLLESEALAIESTNLVPNAVKSMARFTLASTAEAQSRNETGDRKQALLAEARRWLNAYDQFVTADRSDAPLPKTEEALLRWSLVADPGDLSKAVVGLQAAEKAARTADERAHLLMTLESAFRTSDPERGEAYGRELAALELRRRRTSRFALASVSVVDYLIDRGALGEASRHSDTVMEAVSRSHREEIPRVWIRRSIQLESERGFAIRAVARERKELGTGSQRRSREEHAERAALLLAADQPVEALEVAKRAIDTTALRILQRRTEENVMARCRARILEGLASQRLMVFDAAIASFEHAVVESAEFGARPLLLQARIAKAAFYLDAIGDLRQALEHVDDRDQAVADEPVESQLAHTILRIRVHDRRGHTSPIDRLFDAAVARLRGLRRRRPQNTVKLALAALSLGHFERRRQALGLLLDGLALFDDPTARVAAIDGIQDCEAVTGVPSDLKTRLLGLLEDRDAPGNDRLSLELLAIDAQRVVGDSKPATSRLLRLRRFLHKARNPRLNYRVAQLCDRLAVDSSTVLPDDWLSRFLDAHKAYPTLCGAVHVDEGARQFRSLSLDSARTEAMRGLGLLQHPQAIRSILDARANAVLATIANEEGNAREAEAFRRTEAAVLEELGAPGTAAASRVTARRNQAWLEELRDADSFGVRVTSNQEVVLTSWGSRRPELGRTSRTIPPTFQTVLGLLERRPLGGTASLELVQRLAKSWQDFGSALAAACLPPSLVEAISIRMAAPQNSTESRIDIIVESPNHSFHALPWEIAILPGRPPIVCDDRVHHFWRGSEEMLRKTRVTWAQCAISALFKRRLAADGILGPATQRAIESAQSTLGVPSTGVLDVATRRSLRGEALRKHRSRATPDTVLLVQSEFAAQMTSQRGFAATGTDLEAAYMRAGFETRILSEPEPEQLFAALRNARCRVVHFAAPVAESRRGGDLFLRFGMDSTRERSSNVFTASLLATSLKSTKPRGSSPIVLIDAPRPPSLDEAWRQLVLRNVFAAQLFAFGALDVVLATGLADSRFQQQVSDALAAGLRRRESPGDLIQRLRNGTFPGAAPADLDVLGTRCSALFARDPELDPDDLVFESKAV